MVEIQDKVKLYLTPDGLKSIEEQGPYILDEDGDYVAKKAPCPFLGGDNSCSIYENHPSDCMRFPYTDEDVFIKRTNITLKNAYFCPIVMHVLDRLM